MDEEYKDQLFVLTLENSSLFSVECTSQLKSMKYDDISSNECASQISHHSPVNYNFNQSLVKLTPLKKRLSLRKVNNRSCVKQIQDISEKAVKINVFHTAQIIDSNAHTTCSTQTSAHSISNVHNSARSEACTSTHINVHSSAHDNTYSSAHSNAHSSTQKTIPKHDISSKRLLLRCRKRQENTDLCISSPKKMRITSEEIIQICPNASVHSSEMDGKNSEIIFKKCKSARLSTKESTWTGQTKEESKIDIASSFLLKQCQSIQEKATDIIDKELDNIDTSVTELEKRDSIQCAELYYLENFKVVLKSVLEDEYNHCLFNEADLRVVFAFNNLSDECQKLYIRLFSRKLAWLSGTRIRYPEIAEDLSPFLQQLVNAKLLSSDQDLTNMEDLLKILSLSDLRVLAKSYYLNTSGLLKGQVIQALLLKSKQNTITNMLGKKGGNGVQVMTMRAKKKVGNVYRLNQESRSVFVRIMMLFSLVNTSRDEDSSHGGQRQLFQMLQVNTGKIIYPSYKVNRQTVIYKTRQDLIRFEEVLQLESEFIGFIVHGDWNSTYPVFLQAKAHYNAIITNTSLTERDRHLPEFLRYYTAGSVAVRLMSQGIEILQRRKDYMGTVELIQVLLDQNIYNSDLRGYWWDRLALNLDVHLKKQEQALQAIQDALADPAVRSGHRLAIYLRAETICNKPNSPYREWLQHLSHEPLVELPKHFICGRVLTDTVPRMRYRFISNISDVNFNTEDIALCSVEQLVLDYYKMNDFPQGLHAEGSVVSSLFCLYFWHILFMDVPDAFHSPYQLAPLDLHTDCFYKKRQQYIDQHLIFIENSTEEELHTMLAKTWEGQYGVTCAGINWETFSSMEQAQSLISCMGGRILSGILGRYAKEPRHTRGGFPDLILWNSGTKRLKISEVKGPGDRLSHKQMMWLDYLLKLGVDAEVCHVKAIGAKRLKPFTSECQE